MFDDPVTDRLKALEARPAIGQLQSVIGIVALGAAVIGIAIGGWSLVESQEKLTDLDAQVAALNAYNLREELASILDEPDSAMRLQALMMLSESQQLARGSQSGELAMLSTEIETAVEATRAAIEAERIAADQAALEVAKAAEAARLAEEKQRINRVNQQSLRDERVCLNNDCSRWILP